MVWTLRVTRLSYQDHPSPYSSTYGQSLRKVLLGLRQDLSIKAAILSALPIILWNLSNLAQRMLLAECTLSMMNIYQPYRGWLEQKKKKGFASQEFEDASWSMQTLMKSLFGGKTVWVTGQGKQRANKMVAWTCFEICTCNFLNVLAQTLHQYCENTQCNNNYNHKTTQLNLAQCFRTASAEVRLRFF